MAPNTLAHPAGASGGCFRHCGRTGTAATGYASRSPLGRSL